MAATDRRDGDHAGHSDFGVVKLFFLFILFALALIVPPFFFGVGPALLDGILYSGISENLFTHGVFEDIVRNDEILPTIGHPVLIRLAGQSGIFFVGLAALALGLAWTLLTARWWAAIPAFAASLAFSDVFLRSYAAGGVEGSVIFGSALLCSATAWFIRKPSKWSLASLSIAYTISLLIRPVLLPIAPLVLIGALLWAYRKGLRKQLVTVMAGAVLWLGVLAASFGISGDARMITGTYAAIPLFAAWNPFIDLQRNYVSTLWSTPRAKRGAIHFVNNAGWKDRDSRLKEVALNFAKSNPKAAASGYLFRLGRYTISAENGAYLATLVNGYLLALLGAGAWFCYLAGRRASGGMGGMATLLPSAALVFLFAVTVSLSAIFVYAGVRYLIGSFCIMLFILAELGRTATAKLKPSYCGPCSTE